MMEGAKDDMLFCLSDCKVQIAYLNGSNETVPGLIIYQLVRSENGR